MLIDSDSTEPRPPAPRIEIAFRPGGYRSRGQLWKNGFEEYLSIAQKLFPCRSFNPSILTTQHIPCGQLAQQSLTYFKFVSEQMSDPASKLEVVTRESMAIKEIDWGLIS